MININIPDLTNASIQPDYTKVAEFPGFVFYHSLKEWYIIKEDLKVITYPDYSLDELNLSGSFAFLIGSNSNNIYIGQCETATLTKLQINPITAEIISLQLIDLKTDIQTILGTSQDIALTGGYIDGNNIILLITVTNDVPNIDNTPRPYIYVSTNNGINFDLCAMNISAAGQDNQVPIAITKINFNNIFYYLIINNSYETDEMYICGALVDDIINNVNPPQFIFNINTSGFTFGDSTRKHINKQLIWNHNVLYTLSDDRTKLIKLATALEAFDNYSTNIHLPSFQINTVDLVGQSVTQIESVKDNNILTASTTIHKKQDTLSDGNTPISEIITYDKYLLWDEISNNLTTANRNVLNINNYNDNDIILFGLEDIGGNVFHPYITRGGILNSDPILTTFLNDVPMSKFNTGGIHWTGEIVNPIPASWSTSIDSQWISLDEDTELIDYGINPIDYTLTLTIDLPIDVTLTGQIYYDSEVLSIFVDGVDQSLTYNSGIGISTGEAIALVLTKGQHTIDFNMRNAASPGPGNPTGLRIEWNNIDLGSFNADYNDIQVSTINDRIYVLLESTAWVIQLSTLDLLAAIDLHAGELPGGPHPSPTGVDLTNDIPQKWKWLIDPFNQVFVYNKQHDTSLTTLDDKYFYLWLIDETNPSFHLMFDAPLLEVTTRTHSHYFFDNNNLPYAIVSSRAALNLGSIISTDLFRIANLALSSQYVSLGVTVSPNKIFQDHWIANTELYITESDEPNFITPLSDIKVYKNDTPNDYISGTFIAVQDLLGLVNITSQPIGYNIVSRDNFGTAHKFHQIFGDYNANNIISNTNFYKDDYTNLTTSLGNTYNLSYNLVWALSNEDILAISVDLPKYWTYYLTYNRVSSRYRLLRARAVFYPDS